MNGRIRILLYAVVMVALVSAFWAAPVHADDGTPPETPVATEPAPAPASWRWLACALFPSGDRHRWTLRAPAGLGVTRGSRTMRRA